MRFYYLILHRFLHPKDVWALFIHEMFYAFLQSVNVLMRSQISQESNFCFIMTIIADACYCSMRSDFLPSYYFLSPELSHLLLLVTWLIHSLSPIQQIPSLPFATFIIPNCHNVIYLFTRMIYVISKNCPFFLFF